MAEAKTTYPIDHTAAATADFIKFEEVSSNVPRRAGR
jgi:hypothetical protein